MTPRAHRRRLAAAALAAACAIIYLWMLFAWETAWGIDLKHRASPAWLVGTFWQMQWAVACAALVLLAALCAAAEGLELWKRPPRYTERRLGRSEPRRLRRRRVRRRGDCPGGFGVHTAATAPQLSLR